VTAPSVNASCQEGITALEHIPANVPQNAACPRRLSNNMLQMSVNADEAMTFVYCV